MPAPTRAELHFDTPGRRYEPHDFRSLLLRVEHGPERFEAGDTEHARRANEAADWSDEWDEGCEEEEEGDDAPFTPDLSPYDE